MASRDIRDLSPLLQRVFFGFRAWYSKTFPGRTIILTCTYRSPAEQQALFCLGRSKPGNIVTMINGITNKSKHNSLPARAFDFAVKKDGKVTWDEKYYTSAWAFFRRKGLRVRWGGDFSKLRDFPHVEEL